MKCVAQHADACGCGLNVRQSRIHVNEHAAYFMSMGAQPNGGRREGIGSPASLSVLSRGRGGRVFVRAVHVTWIMVYDIRCGRDAYAM